MTLSDDFLEHVVRASSQYDPLAQAMATELLEARKEIVELIGQLMDRNNELLEARLQIGVLTERAERAEAGLASLEREHEALTELYGRECKDNHRLHNGLRWLTANRYRELAAPQANPWGWLLLHEIVVVEDQILRALGYSPESLKD